MSQLTDRITLAIADRYRILSHLGEGGMAMVYLAEDLKHHRQVAVKVLRPELAAVIGAERFVQEIATTASLQHPNILALFDSGRTGGDGQPLGSEFLYYVMPYVEGETLRSKLSRETQLSVDEALRIAGEIADALDYAHRRGVVHRDIKPENILLADGRPLVADFGIALAMSAAGGGRMTETGLSLGTPHYMSPEQATAERQVTNRSDIYSLGCLLFEMLTGEPPHTGASAQAVIMKIVTEPVREVTTLRPNVPPHVAAAINTALEKLPADRFESARAFADALKNPAFGGSSTGAGVRGSRMAARGTSRVVTGAAITVAAASVALAAWALGRSAPTADLPVVRYELPLPMEAGLGNDFGSQIMLSPDGRRLVYVSAIAGTPQLWIRDRDALQAQAIPGTEQAHQPFFSPDGNSIGYITWDRKLKTVSLSGAPALTLADSGIIRGGGTWGEDGFIYMSSGSALTGLGNYGLERIAVSGGTRELVSSLDTARQEVAHRYPELLPGARGLVFSISRERLYDAATTEIGVLDLSTRQHRVLMPGTGVRWSSTGHLLVLRADGAMVAVPFDPQSLEATGPPVPLLDGVNIEELATSDFDLSANGTLIYEPASAARYSHQLQWIDRQGTATSVDPEWRGYIRNPTLSPDGRQVALELVEGGTHIRIKQLDRGPSTRVTFEGRDHSNPVWAPDGRRVAYVTSDGQTRIAMLVRADGSGRPERLFSSTLPAGQLDWARDGSLMVVQLGTSPRASLHSFRPGVDSTPTLLFDSPFDHAFPAISPDGRLLAYVSTESGPPQVFVRPLPDARAAKWQVSVNGGSEPTWSRSGRELFYRDGENRLVAVPVSMGTTPTFGVAVPLFSLSGTAPQDPTRRMFDVSADGQRFLVIRHGNGDDQSVPLIVVDNFFTELRQKVAGR